MPLAAEGQFAPPQGGPAGGNDAGQDGPAAPGQYQPVDLEGLKVLVLDDEPDARELVRRLLEECQAEVVVAESSADGLGRLRRFDADVIVSDIGMPGGDGYEFIKAVRGAGRATPAVALTAFARDQDRANALRAGYQLHLAKPVEPADLLAAVARLAGQARHAERE